jgi:propanol-preferring alcohol dehydrogenase
MPTHSSAPPAVHDDAFSMALEATGSAEDEPLKRVAGRQPSPGPNELLLRVAACGVCRTDLQIVEGDLAARRLPIVPGHQIVGRVLSVGEAVRGWSVGERAGVGWLASACGTCKDCSGGRENLCEAARFTGWDVHGGYSTHVTVAADFALRLPEGFADIDVAPLLCGGVIGYRSLKRSGIQPGGNLGLFGFGASALLAIQVAVHWGCRVFVATRSESEQARARDLGAAWAGSYGDEPPEVLDSAVTFAPSGDVVVAALRRVRRGGTVAINAIHLDRIPQFSYDLLWLERNLVSVANYTRKDATEFLELAATIPVRTRTDVFPLEHANDALLRLRRGEVGGAAVLQPPPTSA